VASCFSKPDDRGVADLAAHPAACLTEGCTYLGLVPSERVSRSTVRWGGITKAGNAMASRAALIESTWTYRMQAHVSRKLHDCVETISQVVRDIAWKAQLRLCACYRRLAAAGKAKVVIITAIAREVVGFLWATARAVQVNAAG
jgi:transposase